MKKSTILLLTVLSVFSLSGQNIIEAIEFNNYKDTKNNFFSSSLSDYKNYKPAINKSGLKGANSKVQRLDSIVNPNVLKQEFQYDNNGNLLSEAYFEWNNGKWNETRKIGFEYNQKNQSLTLTEYISDNNKWKELMKEERIFDNMGNLVKESSYEWVSGRWIKTGISDYTYYENGILKQKINSVWKEGKWLNYQKEINSLDNLGNISTVEFYLWVDDFWNKTSLNEYSYDSLGNVTLEMSYFRLYDRMVYSWKEERTYESGGMEVEIIRSEWDGDVWIYQWKRESVINEDEIETYYSHYIWENDEWFGTQRYESVFNEFGNRIQHSYLKWKDNNWVDDFQIEQFYDNKFAFEDLLLPFWGEVDPELRLLFNHKLVGLTQSRYNGFFWVVDAEYTLYYSEQNPTGTNDLAVKNNLQLYPNPAIYEIQFKNTENIFPCLIEIFDMKGKLVLNQMIENNQSISINSFSEGMFFYKLMSNKKCYCGKFKVIR